MPNGKICYVEIPAADVKRSADFYAKVFGWSIRVRGDGSTAFDDTTGAVSGAWVSGRTPAKDPGAIVYVMVDSIPQTVAAILSGGGWPRRQKRPTARAADRTRRFAIRRAICSGFIRNRPVRRKGGPEWASRGGA
jgi:predicted enzyme related to lactoylglutathione lyase